MSKISEFIDYASTILADTNKGISTKKILNICCEFSNEYNVDIPHKSIGNNLESQTFSNKKTALKENLQQFNDEQVFNIIEYICDLPSMDNNLEFKKVKELLYKNFPQYIKKNKIQNVLNNFESSILFEKFPKSKKAYEDAVNQYKFGVFERNIIDNLRLSLELMVKQLLLNDKSLENNEKDIYILLNQKGCSKEFISMFGKLLDYYCKYNNHNVKHDFNINKNEIEFIFEITYSFIKILAKD